MSSSTKETVDWRIVNDTYQHIKKVPIPMDLEMRENFAHMFNDIPVMHRFESLVIVQHPEIIRVVIPEIRDYHLGGMGINVVNGAVIAGLMDCALGVPGVMQFHNKSAGTIDVSVKMIRPVSGGFTYADGFVVRKTKNIVFCEAYLYDCYGVVCAMAHGAVASG